jgi:hypothetical protein
VGAARASGIPTAISAAAAAAARPDFFSVESVRVEVLIASTRPQPLLRARETMRSHNPIVRCLRLIP